MANDEVLNVILSKLNELSTKIDDVNTRLSQLEHSQQSSQAQMKINRDIQTMTQGQQLTMQYESSSIESELMGWLSPAHVDLIRELALAVNEPLAVYQLKDRMNISRTYVHTLLEQLERGGLVRRIPNLKKLSFPESDNTDNCPDPKTVTPRHLFSLNSSFNFPTELFQYVPELKKSLILPQTA
ncbi:MAG: MarR family transcriptional regulator [Candidatus Hodarchaeales archaeon]|jgi:DNA-binding MarR family transcriptional regulator